MGVMLTVLVCSGDALTATTPDFTSEQGLFKLTVPSTEAG
jgi:hypothetical protein